MLLLPHPTVMCWKVCELISAPDCWDFQKIDGVILPNDSDVIKSIPVSVNDRSDKIIWHCVHWKVYGFRVATGVF